MPKNGQKGLQRRQKSGVKVVSNDYGISAVLDTDGKPVVNVRIFHANFNYKKIVFVFIFTKVWT